MIYKFITTDFSQASRYFLGPSAVGFSKAKKNLEKLALDLFVVKKLNTFFIKKTSTQS